MSDIPVMGGGSVFLLFHFLCGVIPLWKQAESSSYLFLLQESQRHCAEVAELKSILEGNKNALFNMHEQRRSKAKVSTHYSISSEM